MTSSQPSFPLYNLPGFPGFKIRLPEPPQCWNEACTTPVPHGVLSQPRASLSWDLAAAGRNGATALCRLFLPTLPGPEPAPGADPSTLARPRPTLTAEAESRASWSGRSTLRLRRPRHPCLPLTLVRGPEACATSGDRSNVPARPLYRARPPGARTHGHFELGCRSRDASAPEATMAAMAEDSPREPGTE